MDTKYKTGGYEQARNAIIKAIKNILINTDHNNFKIRKKLYLALQQASLIDLAIKNTDRSDNQYIWGLFINLCLYIIK